MSQHSSSWSLLRSSWRWFLIYLTVAGVPGVLWLLHCHCCSSGTRPLSRLLVIVHGRDLHSFLQYDNPVISKLQKSCSNFKSNVFYMLVAVAAAGHFSRIVVVVCRMRIFSWIVYLLLGLFSKFLWSFLDGSAVSPKSRWASKLKRFFCTSVSTKTFSIIGVLNTKMIQTEITFE